MFYFMPLDMFLFHYIPRDFELQNIHYLKPSQRTSSKNILISWEFSS